MFSVIACKDAALTILLWIFIIVGKFETLELGFIVFFFLLYFSYHNIQS